MAKDGYVEINTGPSKEPKSIVEVDLEDVTDGIEEENETDDDEGSVEFDLESGEAKPVKKETPKKEEKKEEPKQQKPKEEDKKSFQQKGSRAKQRIKQLHSEKTDLAKQLDKERKERLELEKKLSEGSKQSKQSQKEILTKNLESLSRNLREAMENGDTEEVLKLQDELMDVKMQIAGVSSELQRMETTPEPEQQQNNQSQQQAEVPEKALEWIEDHPQFTTDELFYVAALTVNNQLINEGYDVEDDEFYEELNTRLAPRFPEVFGTANKNHVQYEEDNKNASDEDEDGNENSSTNNDESSSKPEQTVSGASRTPPHQKGKKGRGKDSVVLSPEMVAQAERWGIGIEKMARRVAHNNKNKRNDGYVPIQITSERN